MKRKSACLACRRIKGRHTHDVLAKLIESIHEEYQIKDKLRGSTTDNGSNFIKCFREKGATSTLRNYEEENNQDYEDDSEDEEMIFFEIGDINNTNSINNTNNINIIIILIDTNVMIIICIVFQTLQCYTPFIGIS